MKVLFVLPKSRLSFFGYSGIISTGFPHLGLAYLISILKYNNLEVDLFIEGENNEQELFTLMNKLKPDLIGVTAYAPTRRFAYEIINKLKQQYIHIPVVIGGPHVSAFKKVVLEETLADFAIKQEGEYTLLELTNALKKQNNNFAEIKGLIWHENSYIVENEDRSFIEDLDNLPFPDFNLFDIKEHPTYNRKIVPIISSRGCPFSCNFCASKLSMGQCFRSRSAQNIFDEIKHDYNKGYRMFDFNDDCFSLDIKRAENILDMIIDSNIDIKFQFLSGLRVDKVNETLLLKLKRAGCCYIHYGCESGNEEVLKDIGKGINLEQARRAVQLTNKAGIVNAVNFIVGNKNETYKKAMDTINFAKSLKNNLVNFGQLIPYPGTPVFEWVKSHGRFLVDENTYIDTFSWESIEPIFETKEFTREERKKVLKKAFALHEFRVLRLRFGKITASIIFLFMRSTFLKKILTKFVLTNKIGNKIAVLLSKRSYKN